MSDSPKQTGGPAFDSLLSKLVKVPKAELDQQIKKKKRAKKRRKKN